MHRTDDGACNSRRAQNFEQQPAVPGTDPLAPARTRELPGTVRTTPSTPDRAATTRADKPCRAETASFPLVPGSYPAPEHTHARHARFAAYVIQMRCRVRTRLHPLVPASYPARFGSLASPSEPAEPAAKSAGASEATSTTVASPTRGTVRIAAPTAAPTR